MLDKSVASIFIDALLEIAIKKGLFEQVEKDLDLICDVMTKHENLKKVLFHPSIARIDKKDTIKKIFGKSVSDLTRNFLYLLVDRKKEEVLEYIPLVYKNAIDEKKGILKARVRTVIPLTGNRLNNLKGRLNRLTGKTVEVEVVRDPNIIGGLVIQIGNKMIDGSVVSRLKNLKTKLMELRTA